MSTVADWCPACLERTSLTERGVCPFCDTPLIVRAVRGGWKRPDRTAQRKLTEAHVRALYRAYSEQGASVNALAKRVYAKVGFKSAKSCASNIYQRFDELGLPRRERIEAVKLACTIHGMAPKHGPRPGYGTYKRRQHRPDQPRCAATKTQAPRKGSRCESPAMFGADFCHQHDPAASNQREAHLAAMRAARPAPDMLAMEPFTAWLRSLLAELGTMREVARTLDGPYTALCQYAKGYGTNKQPKATISAATVERYLGAAGLSLADLYVPTPAIAA